MLEPDPPLRKHYYAYFVLPQLCTSASLAAGFYSIFSAVNGNFMYAIYAIYLSVLFDGMDGLLARLTKTSSSFGVQFDSLSDVVAFGVAPAVLLYSFALNEFDRFGFFVCFIYLACTAIRLARFNVISANASSKYFVGLPCPAAAVCLISLTATLVEYDIDPKSLFWQIILIGLGLSLAFTMVSTFVYVSAKQTKVKGFLAYRKALLSTIVFVGLFTFILKDFSVFMLTLSTSYFLSGPLYYFYRKVLAKNTISDAKKDVSNK